MSSTPCLLLAPTLCDEVAHPPSLVKTRQQGDRRTETLTTDTTHIKTDQTEIDPDQNIRVEATHVKVSVHSAPLGGMTEFRVGRSSSLEAKSPAGYTETDQAQAHLLLLTETERNGTEIRSRRLTETSPATTGQSPATWCGTAALSLPETRGLFLDPTSARQTCR